MVIITSGICSLINKENISSAYVMEKEYTRMLMEILSMVNTRMANELDLEHSHGIVDRFVLNCI